MNQPKRKRYIKPRKPGEKCEFAKLTDDKVLLIRHLHKEGKKAPFLAKYFGVHVRSIYRIIKFKTWAHLKDETK